MIFRVMKPIFMFLSLCLLTVSCIDTEYEKNISFADGIWHKDSVARFSFEVKDIQSPYEMIVSVRNSNSYPYSNLYLFVNIVDPSGTMSRDTVEYDLADVYGKWLGKGWSANYDNDLLLHDRYRFASVGTYRVELIQAMREIRLKGIKDVGFSLRKKN